MKFYRRLQSWVNKKTEEEMQKEIAADRSNPDAGRPLTVACFYNHMDAFEGSVVDRFKISGALVLKNIRDAISDATVVIKDILDDRLEDLRAVLSNDLRLSLNRYWEFVEAWFKATNAAAEKRHQEADDRAGRRQNAVIKHILELQRQQKEDRQVFIAMLKAVCQQITSVDRNSSGRHEAMLNRLQQMDVTNNHDHNQNFAAMRGFFESLTYQVQSKQRVVTEFKPEPTIGWLLERPNELILLGDALRGMRDNDAPFSHALFEAKRACRSLMPCENSLLQLEELLQDVALKWGIVEYRQAA